MRKFETGVCWRCGERHAGEDVSIPICPDCLAAEVKRLAHEEYDAALFIGDRDHNPDHDPDDWM